MTNSFDIAEKSAASVAARQASVSVQKAQDLRRRMTTGPTAGARDAGGAVDSNARIANPERMDTPLRTAAQAPEGAILLHGLCRTGASMRKMEGALAKAGYLVANTDYPSRTASIETLGGEAIDRALSDPKIQSCSRVHFVTHSLGGILVRSYFSSHSPERLGRVVMLGPPNQGSEVVEKLCCSWIFRKLNGPAGSELGTDLNSTPNKLGPVGFELGVIAGDRSINWINSVLIKGKDDGKVSVDRARVEGMKEFLVVHVAHPFLMRNRGVIEYTLRFLKEGTFELKRTTPCRTGVVAEADR